MPTPRITLAVGPATGLVPTQQVTAFGGGRLRCGLNDAADVSFSVPAGSAAARLLDGLTTDVWVYRTGDLYRRCRVLPLTQAWGEDGQDQVSVQAVSYKKLLDYRHIWSGPPIFNGVDQGTIAWSLVEHTQLQTGGGLGVVMGTVATGVIRDRTDYSIGDNIGKLLDQLSGVENGIWWDIDQDRVMEVRLQSDFDAFLTPIVWGQNARTMRRVPAASFANATMATGSDTQTVPATFEALDITTDPRGRWEAVTSNGSITDQTELPENAVGLYEARSAPAAAWTVSLDPKRYFEGDSRYEPGHFVSVNVPSSAVDPVGPPAVSAPAQVMEVSISFDADGATEVALACLETSA